MRKLGWQGMGIVGMALAGTLWLGLPGSTPQHPRNAALAAEEALAPDRLVQKEATALASRLDGAIHKGTMLLASLNETNLSEFARQRILLDCGTQQWPVTLYGPGEAGVMQPPGERYLGADDVADVQRRGGLVVARSEHHVTIAVPTATGQALATRIPVSYFVEGLNGLPASTGVRRYLLDASGKPLSGSPEIDANDREWLENLNKEGEGFLATADALYAMARVPSLGWAVVVRYPIDTLIQPLALEPGVLAGPAMIAMAPLHASPLPSAALVFPLVGAVLLFGIALVGWKQRWPGLEDGPLALGDRALRVVMDPLFKRAEIPNAPAPDSETMALSAEIPNQLPSSLVSEDVEFIRAEQVRALRELWTHTEERLSGQRNWVREEVRRVHETAVTGVSELRNIVNVAEQRLEDAKTAWGDLQASLLKRLDEARASLTSERHAREDGDQGLRTDLSQLNKRMEVAQAEVASRLGHLEDDLDRLQEDLEEVQGERSMGIGDERDRVDSQLEEIERVLRGEMNAVAQATSRLEASFHEQRAQESQEFSAQLEGLEATVQAAMRGVNQLSETMKEKVDQEAIQSKLDEMTRFVFALHQAVQAKPDRDAVNRKLDEIASVVATLQEAERQRPDHVTINGKINEVTHLVHALQEAERARQQELVAGDRVEELRDHVNVLLEDHRSRMDARAGAKLDELTELVQQLGQQGQTLARAVDMNTQATSESEGWVSSQLKSLQEENQVLREALKAMRGEQDGLASRMHMMVQLITKLSK